MVVRVEIVPPHVVFLVKMVLVGEVAHVDVGEDVLELGVVRERNRREWVEVVWVHGLGFADVGKLFGECSLSLACLIWFPGAKV